MEVFQQNNQREDQILKYIPLVEKTVDMMLRSYKGQFERGDLVNIGVIGLMDAIQKYDTSKNTSFETYAKWRIKGAIYDELRTSGKISRTQMDKVNHLYDSTLKLQQRLFRSPTDQELIEFMGISSEKLNEIYSAIHFLSSFSLESTVFSNVSQDFTLKDIVEDKNLKRPDQILEFNEQKELLRFAIEELKEREQIILNLIYFEELPVKDIAQILSISSSRVSQLHGKIIIKIRNSIQQFSESD